MLLYIYQNKTYIFFASIYILIIGLFISGGYNINRHAMYHFIYLKLIGILSATQKFIKLYKKIF